MDKAIYHFELISELIKKELKVRYKNSVLGYFWSVAMPLSQALLYYYAFKYVVKINIPNYSLYLVIGLFPWQWFSNSISGSINAIVGNANIIKKTSLPKELPIIVSVLNDCIHFLLSIPIILLIGLFFNVNIISWKLLYLPLAVIIQFFSVLGISFIISSVGTIFRDIERLVIIGLNFLFYLSPIVYSPSMIPEKFLNIVMMVNPVFCLIEIYRYIFSLEPISCICFFIPVVYSMIIFSLGYFTFSKLKWILPELL